MSSEETAVKPNRWELRACGRRGHATYRPQEAGLAERLRTDTALGPAWRCLRCGTFVLGPPADGGPADAAPLVLRGKALRQATVVQLLAIERLIRAALLGFAVWAVLKFRNAHNSIQAAVDRDLPAFRAVGIHVDQLALVKDLHTCPAAQVVQRATGPPRQLGHRRRDRFTLVALNSSVVVVSR